MVGPDCFLKMANELAANDEEIYIRETIIAAFYAAYHECNILANHLQNHAGMGNQSGSHEDLIRKLSQYPKNNFDGLSEEACFKVRSLGYKLKNCRAQRRLASYDLEASINSDQRDEHLASVGEIISLVDTINEIIDQDESLLSDYKQQRQSYKKN